MPDQYYLLYLDNTSREVETQLRKITEQAPWLKKVTPSGGVFV